MIRLLRESGFDVLDLIEIQPAPDATTTYAWIEHRLGAAMAV